jgi:hypothetical protein
MPTRPPRHTRCCGRGGHGPPHRWRSRLRRPVGLPIAKRGGRPDPASALLLTPRKRRPSTETVAAVDTRGRATPGQRRTEGGCRRQPNSVLSAHPPPIALRATYWRETGGIQAISSARRSGSPSALIRVHRSTSAPRSGHGARTDPTRVTLTRPRGLAGTWRAPELRSRHGKASARGGDLRQDRLPRPRPRAQAGPGPRQLPRLRRPAPVS